MYKLIIRPVLFWFDPEKVHHFVFSSLRIISKIPGVSTLIRSNFEISDPRLEREVFGLKFKNPVGLAAVLIKMLVFIKNWIIWGLVL